jgi:hypothetical protein
MKARDIRHILTLTERPKQAILSNKLKTSTDMLVSLNAVALSKFAGLSDYHQTGHELAFLWKQRYKPVYP